MSRRFSLFRRPRIRNLLFLALLLSGIVPLVISNSILVGQNRSRLETEERTQLTESAESLSRDVSDHVARVRSGLHHLGRGFLVVPGPEELTLRLSEPWVEPYMQEFMYSGLGVQALRLLVATGEGPQVGRRDLTEGVREVREATFMEARDGGAPVFRFVPLGANEEPHASIAVPVVGDDGAIALIPEALVRLPLLEAVFRREAEGQVGIFLIDGAGDVLWSDGVSQEGRQALIDAKIAESFRGGMPIALTHQYDVAGGQRMLAQVSPVTDTDWAVVVQKPASAAFAAIDSMVTSAVAATGLLLLVALATAAYASRRVSRPIQRLAKTSHEIAEGNFGRRMEAEGLPAELSDLASDFNRMSEHVEGYVSQLREAARVNRELFIGSIRAFAAAIDAKDPYTRGHSERVAALSRVIARQLSLPDDVQQTVWIAALLHDVGKIGVEDRVLRKVGQLTDEEYEQMKAHTVIGAEIAGSIEQLREMVPAIRWHHEAWNGRGYPDGKQGDEIPLSARIVAVADTFDAVTTNRPYQKAYALPEAIELITKLTGSRFDARVVTAFLKAYELGEVRTPDPGPAPRAEAVKVARIGVGPIS